MKNIVRIVRFALFFLVLLTFSCAGMEKKEEDRKRYYAKKNECFQERMLFLARTVLPPQNFQSIYEGLGEELEADAKKVKTFTVVLEKGRRYWIGTSILPQEEIVRLLLFKDGKNLEREVSQNPQFFFTPQESGEYEVKLQSHFFSSCSDKLIVSVTVAAAEKAAANQY